MANALSTSFICILLSLIRVSELNFATGMETGELHVCSMANDTMNNLI